jgi:hypothetical protein
MKWHLPQAMQRMLLGTSIVSLPVGAETINNGSAPTEPVNNMAGQLTGFDSLTSEALLLVVLILLVLAVMAHKPKAP